VILLIKFKAGRVVAHRLTFPPHYFKVFLKKIREREVL